MSESIYLKPLQLSDSPRSTLSAGISKSTELKHHYSSQRLGSASSPHSSISRWKPLFCSVILPSISDTPTDQHKSIICLSISTTYINMTMHFALSSFNNEVSLCIGEPLHHDTAVQTLRDG